MSVDKLSFLDKYAVDGQHYDRKQAVRNIILHGSPLVQNRTEYHNRIGDYYFVKAHTNIDEHIDDMRKSNNGFIRGYALHHPSTEEHHLTDLLSHPHVTDAYHMLANHSKATQPVFDHIMDRAGSVSVKKDAILNPNNKNALQHIDTLYAEGNYGTIKQVVRDADASPDIIRHIYSKNPLDDVHVIASHKNTPDDVHESIFNTKMSDTERKTATTVASLKRIKSPDLINKIMSSATKKQLSSGEFHSALLFNKNAPTHHLVDAVNHPKISNATKRFGEGTLMVRGYYDKELGIAESMDSPIPKETVPEDSMLHQMGAMSAAMVGGENFKLHKIGDKGFLVQFDKDGATEVHHVDENLSGGHLVGSDAPSMKMVSTFKNHIQKLLDDGKKVRISAHKNLAPGFASITQRLVKKNPEYKMSTPTDSTHELTGDALTSWELSK